MNRLITVPDDIEAIIGKDNEGADVTRLFAFADFVNETLLQDIRFGIDRTSLKMADEIARAFADAKPGSVVMLRDLAWELLRDVADKPQFGPQKSAYVPVLARQLLPFIDAIITAVLEGAVAGTEGAEPPRKRRETRAH